MRASYGPEQIAVLKVAYQFRAYRIVRSNVLEDPALLNSFCSNYELSREPRRVERDSTVIHMGISTYVREDVARATAEAFPKLGDYIAELSIQPGNGINYAETGHPQHLTMWARPIKLLAAIVAIGAI